MESNTKKELSNLETIARRIRGKLVSLSHDGPAAHLGSSLSCVEILTALYWGALRIDPKKPEAPDRDRVILSKGHAATSLYTALAFKGFFPEDELDNFNRDGGRLPEHPSRQCVPGVEATTGSLGHGLSLGIGMALAGRLQNLSFRVYVIMSDGECNEGSVWEAAMMAPQQKLSNLMAIIDFNKWQATGRSEEVLALQPLRAKWEAFGWHAIEIDGHDLQGMLDLFRKVPDDSGKPIAVIAHTIKGKGVSFMEDDNNWHYRIPTAEEVKLAHRELGLA